MTIKKGDRFMWPGEGPDVAAIQCEVFRVATTGRWADLRYTDLLWGDTWTKRHALPLPPSFQQVT